MGKITYEKMQKLFSEELETFKHKNQNYGNSFEISLNKYGLIAGLTRISDKFNRIERLILNLDSATSDESIKDTLCDLANYCNMLAVYMNLEPKCPNNLHICNTTCFTCENGYDLDGFPQCKLGIKGA